MKISRFGLTVAAAFAVGVIAAPAYAQVTGGPFQYFAVTPCRLVDTRNANGPQGGPAISGQTFRSFPIAGLCGVPTTAQAATLNVTTVATTGGGHTTIWPAGATMPVVSTSNFQAGEPAIANGAIVPLAAYNPLIPGDPTSNASISVFLGIGAPFSAHIVLDVTGYFQ